MESGGRHSLSCHHTPLITNCTKSIEDWIYFVYIDHVVNMLMVSVVLIADGARV